MSKEIIKLLTDFDDHMEKTYHHIAMVAVLAEKLHSEFDMFPDDFVNALFAHWVDIENTRNIYVDMLGDFVKQQKSQN